MNRRVPKRGLYPQVEYLVRWKAYGAHEDWWINRRELLLRAPDLLREREERSPLPIELGNEAAEVTSEKRKKRGRLRKSPNRILVDLFLPGQNQDGSRRAESRQRPNGLLPATAACFRHTLAKIVRRLSLGCQVCDADKRHPYYIAVALHQDATFPDSLRRKAKPKASRLRKQSISKLSGFIQL